MKTEFDINVLAGSGRYVLEVRDNSMQDLGVKSQDWVVVQTTDTAADGDLVVALISGEIATLRQYFSLLDRCVELRPADGDRVSEYYPKAQVKIQGVVVGVFRYLG
jgi:repressor LexA